MNRQWAKQPGFTIVELLIVIVVIAILAAITIVAYNGIQQRATETSLKSDLRQAADLMTLACSDNNGVCPQVLPSAIKVSKGNGLSLSATSDASMFCINGSNSQFSTMAWYYSTDIGSSLPQGLNTGTCSGQVVYGSQTGSQSKNIVLNTDFSSGWALHRQPGNLDVTTRAGTSNDPQSNRPVMIVSNTAAAAGWAYLQGTVSYSDVHSGQSYSLSMWIRRTVGSVPTSAGLNVMEGSATNKALSTTTQTISSSWTKLSWTATAAMDGLSTQVVYIQLPGNITSNWTVEVQDVQITQN